MWILSQDKLRVLNVNSARIETKNDKIYIVTSTESYEIDTFALLGEYSSIERAKVILQQIVSQLRTEIGSDTVIRGVRTARKKVFEMPQR
ncbi:MAG: hypothetical protein ACRDD7_00380 [Peptostreptococcaceae bacterium]